MKKRFAVILALAAAIVLFTAHSAYSQLANCEGTASSPCNVCYLTEAKITIKAPDGATYGPVVLDVLGEEFGSCNSTDPLEKTWNKYVGYVFCPVEGKYNVTFNVTQHDVTSVYEIINRPNLYTVSFDTSQDWCEECGGYLWLGGQCCGNNGTNDDYCVSAGTYASCYDGVSRTNGDFNQYTCNCGAANRWSIGGEVAADACCGDDANEYNLTCNDGQLDVCSGDSYACCNSQSDCVFNNNCYSDESTLTGVGKCTAGVWTDAQGPQTSDNYTSPVDYNNTWVKGVHDINITAVDAESGLDGISTCWGASCTPGVTRYPSPRIERISGTKDSEVLKYRAWDLLQNPSVLKEIIVKLDNTPPTTVCTDCPEPGDRMGTPFTVHLSATDAHSQYSPNGNTTYCVYKYPDQTTCTPSSEYTNGVTIGGDCPQGQACNYTIRYNSTDNLGNQESIKSNPSMILDTNMPWCKFTKGPSAYSGTRSIYMEWDAHDPVSESSFMKYDISAQRKDGGNWVDVDTQTISTEGTKSHTFSLQSDGEFRFRCVVTYDRSGTPISSAPATNSTTVDTVKPTVQLSMPEYSTIESFTISWAASDTGSGVDHTRIYVNSSLLTQVPGTTTQLQYAGQNGRSYKIEVVSYDLAGNSENDTATITVDTQPPQCSINPIGNFINRTTFGISWYSQSQDVKTYSICIRSDTLGCTQASQGWLNLTGTTGQFTGTQGTTYRFRCIATDNAGNTGTWSTAENTTIDAAPPETDEEYSSQVVAGDVIDVMKVNATVKDDFGIKDVELLVGSTKVTPKYKTGATGDLEWILRWEIPYSTYGGYSSFTITVTDINDNMDTKVFNYSILDCLPGQVKPCHPSDKSKDEVYNLGVCAGTGNRTCGLDGRWGNCTGGIFPTAEDCNELDDDCDGQVDEDLERQECGFNSIGICRLGLRDCHNGAWTDCIGAKLPADQETCGNQQDDDCDGSTDEGCVCTEGGTQPCGSSSVGVCQMGTQLCTNGQWSSCQGAILPSAEQCGDGQDNDCDGQVDEGCAEAPVTGEEPFPWWILSVVGAVIVVAVLALWLLFKKKGEELTWDTLKKKYTPAGAS